MAGFALLLAGCAWLGGAGPGPSVPPPTKGFPGPSDVRDSVYLPLDRTTPPPEGYGLYTVLLARSADPVTLRVWTELLATTDDARRAAMKRANLNLITIPVKNVAEALRLLEPARSEPEATAAALMRRSYDYAQAAAVMASICQPARGSEVMKACGGPAAPEGPMLVTARRPLDSAVPLGQPLLVVNLSATGPAAVREVLAMHRRQLLREDFTTVPAVDTWRLLALNQLLEAARWLPEIRKATAATP